MDQFSYKYFAGEELMDLDELIAKVSGEADMNGALTYTT